jgi:hypothetical protein
MPRKSATDKKVKEKIKVETTSPEVKANTITAETKKDPALISTENKSLEVLKTEYQQLSTTITRLGIVVISLLLIITFTVANAFEKADFSQLKNELENAQNLADSYLSAWRMTPDDEQSVSLNQQRYKSWTDAVDKTNEVRKKYNKYLEESLTISPSLLGIGVKVNLLAWIFIIPFIFIFIQFYLFILYKKQSLILIMAKTSLEIEGGRKTDELLFSKNFVKETAFRKYPNQLEKLLYWLIVVSLFSYLTIKSYPIWTPWTYTYALQYLIMISTVSFYLFGYYYQICINLDSQFSQLTTFSFQPYSIVRLWRKTTKNIRKVIQKLKPKTSIFTGSFLIILSLFLSTSASCERLNPEPMPGYELFNWNVTTNWVSIIFVRRDDDLYWANAIDNIGRYTYIFSVILAVLSIALFLLYLVKLDFFKSKKMCAYMCLFSSLCALSVISDFAFNTFWFKDEFFLLSIFCWAIPIILLKKNFLNSGTSKLQKRKMSNIFSIFIFPLIINASIYVFYLAFWGITGLPFYYIGTIVLSLGYMMVWKELEGSTNCQNTTIHRAI